MKNNKTLYYGTIASIKKGLWEKHWLKIVIGFVILGLISTVYKKITGRDLSDEMEKLGDRTEKAVDNFFDDIDK